MTHPERSRCYAARYRNSLSSIAMSGAPSRAASLRSVHYYGFDAQQFATAGLGNGDRQSVALEIGQHLVHRRERRWPRCPVVKTICDYRYGKALTAMRFMNPKPVSSSIDGDARAAALAPRLLYVVSEDWYFLSHRLPMARAARDAGFEVHVATRVEDGAAAIAAEQFILHPIPFARGRLSPLASLTTILALRRIHRAVAPAVTHHVSLQPSVLGLIAALGLPTASVNALTGLGYSFTSTTVKAKS